MGTKEKMITTLRGVTNNKSAISMTKNGGFGDLEQYENTDLYFIKYVLKKFNGLSKTKAAKSIFIVDKIVSCICDGDNTYEDIGKYCCDILEDCKVIKFALPEEE